ncbi:uncharacterized protein PSANT_00987 [Moesziomyces antarcticus]|uniref:Uncharacterized protein n=1 Tax=Pseudozyma antarctica TaxID=84753 RepID=A0A5C3FFW9_PSEA2|nr:uncharacterized protein PSANT_00987 [Moesziomyces antarcticus]
MTQRPTWLATSTGGLLFCRIVPPRPSPDRPTQTALHDTHEQHDSTASTRPAPWLRVLAGAAAPAAGEPAAGRQGKGKAKGKGTGRQRLGRSRIETRGIGVRESGRACWPVNPSLAERKWKIQLQAELGGADRKWSQRIALTAPRSRGRWENWEIIKKIPILPELGERARLHCQSSPAEARQQLAGATPHCGSLRGSRLGAAQVEAVIAASPSSTNTRWWSPSMAARSIDDLCLVRGEH